LRLGGSNSKFNLSRPPSSLEITGGLSK
jgi:hypothetical protein